MQRFFAKVPVWFSCMAAAVLCAVLVLLIPMQPLFESSYRSYSLLQNAALYPFALAAIAALMAVRSRLDRTPAKNERRELWGLAILFLAVLGCQFLVARCCWYWLGWDLATVYTTAEELARGLAVSSGDYFKAYPNNATLTVLHMIPLWAGVKIGLGVPFVVLPYVDAVLLNLSAWLCCMCVRKLSQSRMVRGFSVVLSIVWIALSSYILYPYTDTFSILFPVLAFWLWLRISKPVFRWFSVSLVCFVGAAIKPTVLIVLIALVLLSVCRFLAAADFSASSLKRVLAVAAAVVVGMLPGKLFEDASVRALAGSTHPEEEHGLGYWIMTGMNGETFGGHSDGDVSFANSFSDYQERQAACVSRAWERLSSRSLLQNINFFATKAYKAYADGSFAAHGSFLELEVPQRSDSLSTFLRSFYHRRGAYMPYCQTLLQCLWLGVLTLCAYAAFRLRKNPAVALLCLTLLGLTAYLLLFEVWPRYLFLYAPFFVILASLAFEKPLFSKR